MDTINITIDWYDTKWHWEHKLAWQPVRSSNSGQFLWGKHVWYGCRHVYGVAGEGAVLLEKWLTDEEYVLHLLKGDHAGN